MKGYRGRPRPVLERLAVESLEPRTVLSGYGPLDGSARDIGVGANGAAWVIGTNRVDANGYEIYRRISGGWQKVQGAASRIDVDPNGNPWIVNDFGAIYRWTGDGWTGLVGSARDIGIGANGTTWVIGTNRVDAAGYEIYRRAGDSWQRVTGSASRIDVDQNGHAWIVNDAGEIYRWTGAGWQLLPGSARDIGIGPDGTCWVVGVNAVPGGYGCWRWTGSGWSGAASAATQISVGPSGHPWVVNDRGAIFFGPGVAGTDIVLSPIGSNTETIATNPGALSLPVGIGEVVSNAGAIQGPSSFITINGGGTLEQSGAVNALTLAIGIISSPGLGLSDSGNFSTSLHLTGDATVTAPAGVVVEGILGLSTGSTISHNTPVRVQSQGMLRGSGTVAGRLDVAGVLAPAGNASASERIGRLRIGQLAMTAGSHLEMQVIGPGSDTGYDQIVILESAQVDGAILDVTATFAPHGTGAIMLVDNQGNGPLTGLFRDVSGRWLAEGSTLVVNLAGSGRAGLLSYRGGDGNDVTITLANSPPLNLRLSAQAISEDASRGVVIGVFTADDADPDESLVYELVNDAGPDSETPFVIVGNELKVEGMLDFESRSSYQIRVRATDRFGLSVDNDFVVTITDTLEHWSLEQRPGETIVDAVARSGSSRLVKRGLGTLLLDQANSHSGGTVVEAGELIIRNPAALGTGPLHVAAGAKVTLDVGTRQVPVARLELSPTGVLDLATGSMVLTSGNYDLAAIRGLITSARGTGAWSGPGITSSSIQPGSFREIGFQVLPDGSLKVGYSAVGDANMDGTVSVQDLIALNASGKYGTAATDAGWWQGDFNYDGRVNVTDLITLVSSGLYGAGSYLPSASVEASDFQGTGAAEPVLSVVPAGVTLTGYVTPESQPEPILAEATAAPTTRAPEARRVDEFAWAAIANQSEPKTPNDRKVARWRFVGL